MNNKGVTKLAAGIIIAIVLIGAFLVPLALTLVQTTPRTGGNPFNTSPTPSVGVLGMDFSLVNTVQIESGVVQLFLLEGGPSGSGLCIFSTWIQNKMNQVFGFPLVRFQEVQFNFVEDATRTVGGAAQSVTTLEPGDYQFVIQVNCAIAVKLIDIVWELGSSNIGNSGIVEEGLLQDFDNDGSWSDYPMNPFSLFNVNIDGTIIAIPEPPLPPPDGEPPVNVTEDGDALIDTLNDTGDITPPDTTQAISMIIIGIIVLVVGIIIAIAGRGNIAATIIGILTFIIGLAIVAAGAFIFFTPGG